MGGGETAHVVVEGKLDDLVDHAAVGEEVVAVRRECDPLGGRLGAYHFEGVLVEGEGDGSRAALPGLGTDMAEEAHVSAVHTVEHTDNAYGLVMLGVHG